MTNIITSPSKGGKLIGYWNFNQGVTSGSGGSWNDLSGNNITLSFTGSPTLDANGVSFDGSSALARSATGAIPITQGSAFTLEVGFIPAVLPTSTKQIVGCGSTSGTSVEELSLYQSTPREGTLYYGTVASTYTSLSVGTLANVAVTFDPSVSTTIRNIYVNGSPQGTVNAGTAYFGGSLTVGGYEAIAQFNGHIAFVRIYNCALTASEVSTNNSVGTAIGLPSGGQTDTLTSSTKSNTFSSLNANIMHNLTSNNIVKAYSSQQPSLTHNISSSTISKSYSNTSLSNVKVLSSNVISTTVSNAFIGIVRGIGSQNIDTTKTVSPLALNKTLNSSTISRTYTSSIASKLIPLSSSYVDKTYANATPNVSHSLTVQSVSKTYSTLIESNHDLMNASTVSASHSSSVMGVIRGIGSKTVDNSIQSSSIVLSYPLVGNQIGHTYTNSSLKEEHNLTSSITSRTYTSGTLINGLYSNAVSRSYSSSSLSIKYGFYGANSPSKTVNNTPFLGIVHNITGSTVDKSLAVGNVSNLMDVKSTSVSRGYSASNVKNTNVLNASQIGNGKTNASLTKIVGYKANTLSETMLASKLSLLLNVNSHNISVSTSRSDINRIFALYGNEIGNSKIVGVVTVGNNAIVAYVELRGEHIVYVPLEGSHTIYNSLNGESIVSSTFVGEVG